MFDFYQASPTHTFLERLRFSREVVEKMDRAFEESSAEGRKLYTFNVGDFSQPSDHQANDDTRRHQDST